MKAKVLLVFAVFIFLSASLATGQGNKAISASEARQHIGEKATVCGTVASEHFAANAKGQPTFINLDKPYPTQVFTIVIWGADRALFGTIPGKLCVTGTISSYRGTPEIIARAANQITPE